MIKYGFFNSKTTIAGTYDRKYNAEDINKFFEGAISRDGVYKFVGNQCKAMVSTGMNVIIQTGKGSINYHWFTIDANESITIEASHATLNRYDAIVMRYDGNNRNISLNVIKGTPAESPVKPTITKGEITREICLAYVYVGAAVTSITAANIIDAVEDVTVCGYVKTLLDNSGSGGVTIVDKLPTASASELGKIYYLEVKWGDYDIDFYKVKASSFVYGFSTVNYISDVFANRPIAGKEYEKIIFYASDTEAWYICELNSSDVYEWKTLSVTVAPSLPTASEATSGKYYVVGTTLYLGNTTGSGYEWVSMGSGGGINIDEAHSDAAGYLMRNEDKTFVVKASGVSEHFHYQVEVDNGAISDPSNYEGCRYLGENSNFIPATAYGGLGHCMGSWEYTKLFKEFMQPCVMNYNEKTPKYFLNKNDYTKIDTTIQTQFLIDNPTRVNSDLTGAEGDVFVRFKKLFIKFERLSVWSANDKVIIHIADTKIDSNYECTTEYINDDGNTYTKDYVYIGAYTGAMYSSRFSSVSGVNSLVNTTRDTYVSYCLQKTNLLKTETGLENEFYNLESERTRNWLWCLGVLFWRNKYLNGAVGTGRVATGNTSAIANGTMNTSGFSWGNTNQTSGVKFLGIENLWGNLYTFEPFHAIKNRNVSQRLNVQPYVYMTRNMNPIKFSSQGVGYELTYEYPLTALAMCGNNASGGIYYGKKMEMTNLMNMSKVIEVGASLSTYMNNTGNWGVSSGAQGNEFGAGEWCLTVYGGCWSIAAYACLLCRGDTLVGGADTLYGARLCRY